MKEKLIQEISNAMTEILNVEQMAQLNGVYHCRRRRESA